jgi:hypothetical protein
VICFTLLYSSSAWASEDYQIHGAIKVKIKFSKEKAESAKLWIKGAVEKSKADTKNQILSEKNPGQKLSLENTLAQQNLIGTESFFSDNTDGTTNLASGLPFVTVKIGDYSTTTDAKSEFLISEKIEEGDYPLTVIYQEQEIYSTTVHIEENKNLNIVINQDEDGLSKAAKRMGESVQTQGEQETKGISTIPIAVAATSTTQILFPAYPVNTAVPWSKGDGTMWIIKSGNLVGCNKADNASSDGGYETNSFPWNDSDCAKAIALGSAYSVNPIAFSSYYMNYNCYIEGFQQMTGEGTNIYCNGKEKSGYHFNCSWLYGINHTETLHAHS